MAVMTSRMENQHVDLGNLSEACITVPQTCRPEGAAVAMWLKVIECTYAGSSHPAVHNLLGWSLCVLMGHLWSKYNCLKSTLRTFWTQFDVLTVEINFLARFAKFAKFISKKLNCNLWPQYVFIGTLKKHYDTYVYIFILQLKSLLVNES